MGGSLIVIAISTFFVTSVARHRCMVALMMVRGTICATCATTLLLRKRAGRGWREEGRWGAVVWVGWWQGEQPRRVVGVTTGTSGRASSVT